MKIWFWILGLLWFTPSLSPDEMRGIWVDAFGPGFLNKQQVRQLGETCRKYNFNAVFVEIRKRGDAYYFPQAPNDEPRAPELAPDFDPLAEIIKECHGKEPRIEVHAWVVGCFVWAFDKPPREKNHVYNRHKDWLTRDSIGQTIVGQGYFLDLGHPEAATYLLNVVKDIVTHYDVDGLHWDYLRYPHQDSGYNEVALKRFKEEFAFEKNPLPDDPKFLDSDQCFACGFLQIPPRDGHPCRPANSSPCRACIGLQPTDQCALPGAPNEKAALVGAALDGSKQPIHPDWLRSAL